MNREVSVHGLHYSQSQVGTYVCLLSEDIGTRKLPIIVNSADAQVIALKVENMKSPRPLMADVVDNVIDAFGGFCREVVIYNILEGVFYAKIVVSNHVDTFDIECTAGAAITLSKVFNCPLFVDEKVLDSTGIEIGDDGEPVEEEHQPSESVVRIEDLERMLEDALDSEDYMLAAELRDKIQDRKEQEQ